MAGQVSTASVVLTTRQFEAMKLRATDGAYRSVLGNEVSRSEALAARKKDLHAKSLAETQTWSRTVAGERQKRLQAKAARKAEQEKQAKQIDLEEERYQAAKRKEQLDRAKLLMLQQKDGMKAFRSAQLLTEVIRERDNQGSSSDARQKLMQEKELEYLQYQLEQNEKAIKAEVEKQHNRRMKEMETAATQLEQAAAIREVRRKERAVEMARQKGILEDSQKHVAEQATRHEQQRQKNRKFLESMRQEDDANAAIRAQEKELERLEEERNAHFLAAKEVIVKERQEKALGKRKELAKARQDLADSLFVQIESNEAEEDARIAKCVEERERQQDEAAKSKAAARAAANKATIDHMYRKIADTQQAREQRLAEEKREREEIISDSKAYFAKKAEEKHKKKEDNRGLLKTWTAQMTEKEKTSQSHKEEMLAYKAEQEKAVLEEKQELETYIKATEQFMTDRGCQNLYPMKQAAAAIKPWQPKPEPNLPSTQTRRKGNPYPGDTKKRLGFTWE